MQLKLISLVIFLQACGSLDEKADRALLLMEQQNSQVVSVQETPKPVAVAHSGVPETPAVIQEPKAAETQEQPVAVEVIPELIGDTNETNQIAVEETPAEELPIEENNAPAVVLSPEEIRLNAMDIDYFLDLGTAGTATLAVRERDQATAEAAVSDIITMQSGLVNWVIKFRPDSEVLTKNGFAAPPPAVEVILANWGITDYEINNGVLTVESWQLIDAESAAKILTVFYPDTTWTAAAR